MYEVVELFRVEHYSRACLDGVSNIHDDYIKRFVTTAAFYNKKELSDYCCTVSLW
jgi:hypothetical protein